MTPTAASSAVSTGSSHDIGTNETDARLYTSSGAQDCNARASETRSLRSASISSMRSAIAARFGYEDADFRATPATSYPSASRSSASSEPSWPPIPVMNARLGIDRS